jgi:hypothetical protein
LNAAPAPVLEELEDDIDNVSMSIIDGWGTCVVFLASFLACGKILTAKCVAILPISSPPSASPLSSQDTEIDELWEASPTPPGTPATSLFSARMGERIFMYPMHFSDVANHVFPDFHHGLVDEVEIPRIHKPGHTLPHSLKPRGSSRCVL